MAKVIKKSVVPIYTVAAVWLVWATLLPLYRPVHYLLAGAVSVVAFLAAHKLCPDRTLIVPDPEPAPEPQSQETENPELDALIKERERAVSEMRRLNDNIKDAHISAQIDHLEEVTQKIVGYVVEHPQKRNQIQKFLNYYLPTTLKLLNAYDRMGAAGISGTNIDGTMRKIETMMDTAVQAFDRQLDALFADEALDISTDITVMENLLAQEGLTGQQFQ